jgi:hypothetical protein
MSSDAPRARQEWRGLCLPQHLDGGLSWVDSGVPDNNVDAGRVVVLPYLGDLAERVRSHGDEVLAAPALLGGPAGMVTTAESTGPDWVNDEGRARGVLGRAGRLGITR